ncbi:MAG: transcriptional activator RfaH [Xanthomonadaceae bacterium]|nr:transcriptional activator RfaH [Xanthomonadaceae bacterium]
MSALPSPLPETPRWYCVHTKPRAELQAIAHLQQQAFECFLPRLRRSTARAGKRQTSIEPLFPRYLFLRANPHQQSLAAVRSTRGVLGLVRFANQPGEVPPALVEGLRRDADADGVIQQIELTPQPGDAVTLLAGAFAGLRGVYAELQGQQRAIVLLQLLGGVQRVALPPGWLQISGAGCLA